MSAPSARRQEVGGAAWPPVGHGAEDKMYVIPRDAQTLTRLINTVLSTDAGVHRPRTKVMTF